MLLLEEEMVGDNDLSNTRKVKLSNDKEILVYRQGQYGMWKIRYEHGIISPQLEGIFTTFEKALKEVEVYFRKKKITIIDVED